MHYQIEKLAFGALDSATLAASGAGAVTAGVQRMTLASDDPAVVDLAAIEVLLTTTNTKIDELLTDTELRATAVPVSLATVPSHAVTNAGTFATQVDGAALTALQLIDDPVLVMGTATYAEATTKGVAVGAVRRDADTTAVNTDNEIAPLLVNAIGALKVEIFDGGDSHTVDGTVTANLAAGTNNIGDVDILSIAAGDNNIGNVDVVTLPNVTLAAGTNTNEVVGDVAHDAGVAGNPVLVAGAAQDTDDTAPPNRVSAESDATRLATDRDGAVFVRPHGPQVWSYHLDTSTAQTDASVHAAPGAGLSLYVTDIVFSSGAATAINLFFEEGASKVLGPYYLEAAAGRGMALHFVTPKKITANTALTLTTSAAIAHSVDVTGFTAQG